MEQALLVYLLLINAAGFLSMLADKQRARKKKWRISEAALMAIAALGGSLGSLAGMYAFRHKTRRKKFTAGIPLLLAVQAVLLWFLSQYRIRLL